MGKVILSFSYQEETKEKLQELAIKSNRSLPNYIATKILDTEIKNIITKRRKK